MARMNDLTVEPEHTPRRPDWICRHCYRPWPCPARQAMLIAESRSHPVAVALYLATCYQEASQHLTDVAPDVLYNRMLGWLPRARRPQ
jgi:hypothetical protein